MSLSTPSAAVTRHQIERVRHDTRCRTLTVETVTQLTSHMLRIGFVAEDLHDFVSVWPDDHVKLFLPGEGRARRDARLHAASV